MSMLIVSLPEDTHTEVPMDLNEWLANFDASAFTAPDLSTALGPPQPAANALVNGPSPEDPYDWTGLLALSTASLDHNLLNAPHSSWSAPTNSSSLVEAPPQPPSSFLGFQDFQPLAQVIAQGVTGDGWGSSDVQARVMEVLWQLASHPQS